MDLFKKRTTVAMLFVAFLATVAVPVSLSISNREWDTEGKVNVRSIIRAHPRKTSQ